MTIDCTPNRIPRSERFLNVLYAAAILAFGVLGLTTGGLLLPGKRTSGPNGVALQGLPAWVMYAAMICACAVLLSVVVDHYDRRNNEINYRRFAQVGKLLGWSLFFLSLALYALGAASENSFKPNPHKDGALVASFRPYLHTAACLLQFGWFRRES